MNTIVKFLETFIFILYTILIYGKFPSAIILVDYRATWTTFKPKLKK